MIAKLPSQNFIYQIAHFCATQQQPSGKYIAKSTTIKDLGHMMVMTFNHVLRQ